MRSKKEHACRLRAVRATSATVAACLVIAAPGRAQQAVPRGDAVPGASAAPKSTAATADAATRLALPEPAGAKRLSPKHPVWVDPKEKVVIVDGQISLREGMLEMFACTRNTKEHEAVVSADTKAYFVHAALLGLGAEPGHPARFQPEYQPPAGTEVEVLVQWLDESGKKRSARAQDWVRDVHTRKAMTYPFVFGGSGFWSDPQTGQKHYQAEGGDFVCVSNFGTAMLDIPVKSSQANESLEFEAFTERIPPLGAPVRLIFKPKLKVEAQANGGPGDKAGSSATKTSGEAK